MRSSSHRLLAMWILPLLLAACGGDDPVGPGSGGSDSIAPVIVDVSPSDGSAGLEGNTPLVVVFSEAMDPASVAGALSVSTGDTLVPTWSDDRTLHIEHPWFRYGDWITVSIGTGLTDRAGNPLVAPHEWSFGVVAQRVTLMASDPADGATDVTRSRSIALQFDRAIDLGSLANHLIIETGTVARAYPVGFTLEEGRYGQVIVVPDSDLPPGLEITVLVQAGVASPEGGVLEQDAGFSFTAGADSDSTPPALVAVSPAEGDALDPMTPAIVLEFSEPIAVHAPGEAVWSAQLAMQLALHGLEPYWSADRTTMTIPLPTPLPDGLPILFGTDNLSDRSGNLSAQPVEYRTTVTGTADLFPARDGARAWFHRSGSIISGAQGSGFQGYDDTRFERLGDDIWRITKTDELQEQPVGYEELRIGPGSIRRTAVAEAVDGVLEDPVAFSPPIELLRLPGEGQMSWSGTSSISFEGQAATLEYTITVLGELDLPLKYQTDVFGGPEYREIGLESVWANTLKTVMDYSIKVGEMEFVTASDTTWYAPGVGRVRREATERRPADGGRIITREHFVGIDLREVER